MIPDSPAEVNTWLLALSDAAEHGDTATLEETNRVLERDGTRVAAAARMVLDTLRHIAGTRDRPVFDVTALNALSDHAETRPFAWHAWMAHASLSALIPGDPNRPAIVAYFRGSARSEPSSASAAMVFEAYDDIASGDPAHALSALTTIESQARNERLAIVQLRAAVGRAIAASLLDLNEARAIARRAVRMARTEGIRQPFLLASVALARIRRLTGHAHLATTILTSVAKIAPASWAPLLSWELMMASGGTVAPPNGHHGAALLLLQALEAARAGDRSAFDARFEALSQHMASDQRYLYDVKLARAALDPMMTTSDNDPLADFRRGVVNAPPLGIDGLMGANTESEAVAWAIRFRDGETVRVLAPGLPLANDPLLLGAHDEGKVRARVALPVLLLARPSVVPESWLFEQVYGFTYRRSLHRNPLNILIHRVRQELPDGVALVREEGAVSLQTDLAIAAPDVRCMLDLDGRILRLLAERRASSAKEAAQQLHVPLRTVQAALEALVAAGECDRDRSGRHIDYHLEDTTFEEPTAL